MDLLKKNLPHLIAFVLFLIIAGTYSSPLLEGKKLQTHDYNVYMSVSRENTNYENENGRLVFWNNSMFSGMPDYAITTAKKENIFFKIYKFLIFGDAIPFNLIFWYLLGFYILLNVFKINPWLSIAGAIGFAFSSYFFIIIAAGHFTKAIAIGFMAPIFAGFYLAYERKQAWAGMFLMTFFLALQILSNHVQITYYTGMMVLVYVIFEFVYSIREKTIINYLKTSGILILGVVLAIGINAAFILTNQEYIKYSIRGKSELSTAQHDRTTGLDKSYATSWSYGIDETFTLLIPNAKGGASGTKISEDAASMQVIEKYFGRQAVKELSKSMPTYFGDQPFTSGPVYVGAAIVFLFIFGLLVVKGKIKWCLLTITIISIILSWGKNFDVVTHFFLDYVPGYNKFRTVSMILVLAEFAMPLLGILVIKEIIENKIDTKKLLNSFYIALGTTGLITMAFIVNPTITGISGEGKSEMEFAKILASYFPDGPEYASAKEDFQNSLVNAIYEDRADMVRNDALRSLFFIMLAAGVVLLLIKNKIKPNLAIAAFALIFIADLWTINRRYLNDENYVSKRKYEIPYEKTIADESILKDNDLHYRVCNVYVSTFNDGSTSFYHRSIGGYSGAKIRRYQELYDSLMWREIELVKYIANTALQSGFKHEDIQNIFDSKAVTPILNMLNSKYIIYNPNMPALVNKNALGNAWFVSKFNWVENADKEISMLRNINPANEAIIDQRFNDIIGNFTPSEDSLATIKLIDYAPDYLVYKSNTSKDMLAVFSEVYYPKGWRVNIDNKESKHFRVNYVLRAMIVPAGEHTITFKYESEMYKTGVIISYICSILLLLLIALGIWLNYKKYIKSKSE